MHPILTFVFGQPVHLYAVAIATGFVLGVVGAARNAHRFGYSKDMVLDLCWWLLVMGLVGSRIAFILTNWEQYYYPCTDVEYYNTLKLERPLLDPDCWRLLRFWSGGLVFYGGPIASIATLFVFMRREKLPSLPVADLIIPYLALGQAFGRLGCFAAGCCFGKQSHGALAVHFPPDSMAWEQHVRAGLIGPDSPTSLGVHPTQIYDAATGFLLFGALLLIRSRRKFDGQVLASWLVLYPIVRSLNELFRGDDDRKFLTEIVIEPLNRLLGFAPGSVTFLSTSQFISIGVIALGVTLYLRMRHRPLAAVGVPPPEPVSAESN